MSHAIDRRDFLLLKTSANRAAELSCERLYMRFVDAHADGSEARLFDLLARDLSNVSEVQLTDRAWLSAADFRRALDAVLELFVKNGGRVT